MNTTDNPNDAVRALKELVRRIEIGEYRITRFCVRKTNEREAYVSSAPLSDMSVSEGSVNAESTVNYREGIGFEVAVMETYDARYDGSRPAPRGNIFDPPVERYMTKAGPQRTAWNSWEYDKGMPFNVADEFAREKVAQAQRESAARAEAEAKRLQAKLRRAADKAAKEEAAAKKGKPFGARDLDID